MGYYIKRKGRSRSSGGYRQNHGKPGVVYILTNSAFTAGLYKIGCSTRSGAARAADLNSDANTGTPALFSCNFEVRTLDCGLAEHCVFAELSDSRTGKRGQEYFRVDLDRAKEVIRRVCADVDQECRQRPPVFPKEVRTVASPIASSPPLRSHAETADISSSQKTSAPATSGPVKGLKKGPSNTGFPVGKIIVFAGLAWVVYLGLQPDKPKSGRSPQPSIAATTFQRSSVKTLVPKAAESTESPQLPHHTDQGGEKAAIAAMEIYEREHSTDLAKLQKEAAESGLGKSDQAAHGATELVQPKAENHGRQEGVDAGRETLVVSMTDLSRSEKQSLESVCSSAKYNLGPTAYNDCLSSHLARFNLSKRPKGIDALTSDERRSLESACSSAKYIRGPSEYNDCLNNQLARFDPHSRPTGLASLTGDERRSIESVCSSAKYNSGPAAYNECLNSQLLRFDLASRPNGISSLTTDERRSLESVCSSAKYNGGPAAYNECLSSQMARFDPRRRPTGLAALTSDERRSLESACSSAKYNVGPSAYNECLNSHLARFDPQSRPTGIGR